MIYIILLTTLTFLSSFALGQVFELVGNESFRRELTKRRIIRYLRKHGSASASEISKALGKRNMDIIPLLIVMQREEKVTAEKIPTDEGYLVKIYTAI